MSNLSIGLRTGSLATAAEAHHVLEDLLRRPSVRRSL